MGSPFRLKLILRGLSAESWLQGQRHGHITLVHYVGGVALIK